jgi:hypothetical protein
MHARESRMTPQEQELVDELFDRLARLETSTRDPDAERVIADGVRRAPHAIYALVQTALVMDEALKRANARIEELQAQLGGDGQQQPGGFLDSMRDAVLGRRDQRGSVPSVRAQTPSSSVPPAYPPEGGYPPQMPPPYPMGPAFGSGGSFLGTAASTAAGMIGGGLLLDGIRSMFGHQAGVGGHARSTFASSGDQNAAAGSAADSDLARAAGIDSIGRGGAEQHRGPADTALSDKPDDWDAAGDNDFADDDGGDFGGDDSDFA